MEPVGRIGFCRFNCLSKIKAFNLRLVLTVQHYEIGTASHRLINSFIS